MNKELYFSDDIRENEALRAGFTALAKKVFGGLDFGPWYASGYWRDAYIPHVLAAGDRVVANVSVNIIDTRWRGKDRRYLQIGTVMADPECRGQGLVRRLMEAVLAKWQGRCDAIYLLANDTVVDFYPRFGFVQAQQYQCGMDVTPMSLPYRKLNLDSPGDEALLLRMYRRGNPYAELPMLNNEGLLMFHCGSYLRDCLYYFKAIDALAVAEYDDGGFLCYDVFGEGGQPLAAILAGLARKNRTRATLGFTPVDPAGFTLAKREEEDETLFVLASGENPFREDRLMVPLLSHA